MVEILEPILKPPDSDKDDLVHYRAKDEFGSEIKDKALCGAWLSGKIVPPPVNCVVCVELKRAEQGRPL